MMGNHTQDDSPRRVRVIISGRVQGVAFRYATLREARHLGVVGWVRNRQDGTVEILAQGSPAKIDDLLRWSHTGPPAARVTGVRYADEESDGTLIGFDLRY